MYIHVHVLFILYNTYVAMLMVEVQYIGYEQTSAMVSMHSR